MDDHPVHTRPFQTPLKMDVLAKTFLHIILAAKWLVRYSSIRPIPVHWLGTTTLPSYSINQGFCHPPSCEWPYSRAELHSPKYLMNLRIQNGACHGCKGILYYWFLARYARTYSYICKQKSDIFPCPRSDHDRLGFYAENQIIFGTV